MSHKVRTTELGQFIQKQLDERLATTIRLGVTETVVVKFTRKELRSLCGTSRIEDTSIQRMIDELTEVGYEVEGKDTAHHWTVSFDPIPFLTQVGTLEELITGNQWLDEVFPKVKAVTPAQTEE